MRGVEGRGESTRSRRYVIIIYYLTVMISWYPSIYFDFWSVAMFARETAIYVPNFENRVIRVAAFHISAQ